MSGLRMTLEAPFEEVLARVPGALATEGFGILTEIDVQATLRKKLDVDFRRYRILGACNPGVAHRALQRSLEIGRVMPCNVVVYEEGRGTVVSAVDPLQTIAAQGEAAMRPLAEEARQKLERALLALANEVAALRS
ncbi:MAG TPA: DUF302 domain-containing protein [Vicinamibacteria bacterium]|nr:DUF302 domain-containing protein [Vicinamibacteria bacterium]